MRIKEPNRIPLVLPFDPIRQKALTDRYKARLIKWLGLDPEKGISADAMRDLVHTWNAISDKGFPLAYEQHRGIVNERLRAQAEEVCPALFPPASRGRIFIEAAGEVFEKRTGKHPLSYLAIFRGFVHLLIHRRKHPKQFPKTRSQRRKLEEKQGKLFDAITPANKKTPYSM